MKKRIHFKLICRSFMWIFFLCIVGFGQSTKEISGMVIDSVSGKPLVGVNIYIPDKMGTVTDEDGYFYLSVSHREFSDSLYFSFIGYKEKGIKISQLKKQTTVFLQPKMLMMEKKIVVTADRENLGNREIKTSTSKIRLKELERLSSFNIADAFKSISSVRIEGNDLDGRTIEIRGSKANEVKVYMDGILVNGIGHNEAADLSIVPVEDLQEISVQKSGNLLLTGQGAFGGVVNIQTRKPSELKFKIYGDAGNYKSRNGGGFLHLPLRRKFAFKYYFNYSEFYPEIEYFPDEKFSSKTLNDQITTIKHFHHVSLSYFSSIGRWVGTIFNYRMNYLKSDWWNKINNWLYSFRFQGTRGWVKDFEFTLSHNFEENNLKRQVDSAVSYRYDDFLNRTNLKIAKKIDFKGSFLQWVADYYHDQLNTKVIQRQPNIIGTLKRGNMYDNHAGSAIVLTFNDHHPRYEFLKWSTYLGFRGDVLASGDRDFSKAVGGTVDLELENSKYKLYFNHGNNVKYPNLIERVYLRNFQKISLADTVESRIKPEYLTSYQVGIEGDFKNISPLFGQLSVSLAFFHNDTYNALLRRPFGEFIVQDQTGRSSSEGIELELQMIDLFEKVNLSLGALGMNISNKLLYAFKPRTNLSIQLAFNPTRNIGMTGRIYREGNSYGWYYTQTDSLKTEQIHSFWDIDFTFSGHFTFVGQKMGVKFSGTNIRDAAGYSYYYLKKRFWQFGSWLEF